MDDDMVIKKRDEYQINNQTFGVSVYMSVSMLCGRE